MFVRDLLVPGLALLVSLTACFAESESSEASASAEDTGGDGDGDGEECTDEVDECGVCDGPGGPCFGCTVPEASNYDELAEVDDNSCTCDGDGGNVSDQAQTERTGSGGGMGQWQSFTTGFGGALTQVELEVGSPLMLQDGMGRIRLYEGEGNTGALLAEVDVVFEATPFLEFQRFEFTEPAVVTAEAVYTIEFSAAMQNVGWVAHNSNDPYDRGRSSLGPETDFLFRTFIKPCEK